MLRLLIFAPCDKVIIAEGGQTSAIGVLEAVQVGIAKGSQLISEAMIPYKWSILTLWHREEDVSTPIKYRQRIVCLRPDKVEALKIEGEFEVSNAFKNFRQNVDIPFLPAGLVGQYSLTLFLQKENEDWQEIAVFPVNIGHKPTDVEIKQTTELTISRTEPIKS